MKKILSLLAILFSHLLLVAETTVYFYGPVTSSQDTTTKLTSDLFFSQLQSISGYSLVDNRDIMWQDEIANQINEDETILFYVEIQESNQNWECTLTVIDSETKNRIAKTEIFDGYYKILMEAKKTLLGLLEDYTTQKGTVISTSEKPSSSHKMSLSLDTLSGTWKGDNHISKIVILRGGKGFVIYKNGASMNIQVSIQGDLIFAQQTSRANASFFPDLPREVALVVAKDALPIEWELSLIDNNTLSGEKVTLMPKENGAELQTVNVTWQRDQ